MAKQQLPTNFKDDILATQMAGKRRYRIIQNDDGTVSLEDVTDYSRVGNDFGSAQINATNMAVNESFDKNKVIDSLDDIAANESAGYAAGALAVRELNGKLQDTGWVDVKMGNGIVTDTQAPQVRRVGKLVYLRGVVRNNTSWSTHESFLTIPNNFRPAYTHRCIQTSYGSFRYRLEVLADGQCKALAITNDTEGNATIEKGKWFQVDTCWYVD